jgi:hypothetical protein
VLRELIGLSLDTAMADLYGGGRARRNCTHLFDLAVLALRQARRNENERCYDACVPDEKNTPVTVEVRRNNQLIHAWQVSAGIITAPAVFAGQSLTTGFTPWALRTFANEAGADDALEAALVLHKSYYLAQARRYHTEAFAGQLLSANAVLQGVCHSYASGQIETARFTGNNVRDFSAAVIEAVVLE